MSDGDGGGEVNGRDGNEESGHDGGGGDNRESDDGSGVNGRDGRGGGESFHDGDGVNGGGGYEDHDGENGDARGGNGNGGVEWVVLPRHGDAYGTCQSSLLGQHCIGLPECDAYDIYLFPL